MKYLRRLLWFCTVHLFGVCVVGALLVITFYLSMNITNILILLTDGMEARAEVILNIDQDTQELEKFFNQNCLSQDAMIQKVLADGYAYIDYDIRGFDHRLTVEWIWSWPWDDTASAIILEAVPAIDGKIKSGLREEALKLGGEARLYPPEWGNARYRVTLERESGRWKISALNVVETWQDSQ